MPIDPPSNINVPSSMPGKPIPPSSMGPKRSSIRVIIMIIVLLVIFGGAAAYYFLVYLKDDTVRNSNNVEVVNNSNAELNLNTSNINDQVVNKFVANTNLNSLPPPFNLPDKKELDEINDPDGDGLLSGVEPLYGANPNIADTDGDGYDDYTEVNSCFNPDGEGRMNMSLYSNYCHNFFINHIEEGIITSDAADALCNLWNPYIQQVIDNDGKVSVDSIWMKMELKEYDDKCTQFNDQYSVNYDDEDTTICDVSFFLATEFCNNEKYN